LVSKLRNNSLAGTSVSSGFWCCDRHSGPYGDLDLLLWFNDLPLSLQEKDDDAANPTSQKKRKREAVRRRDQRAPVVKLIEDWRSKQYNEHPLRGLRTEFEIISPKGISAVARIHPKNVSEVAIFTAVALMSPWSQQYATALAELVTRYDAAASAISQVKEEFEELASPVSSQEEPLWKRARLSDDLGPTGSKSEVGQPSQNELTDRTNAL
jgi:hypothetical protein